MVPSNYQKSHKHDQEDNKGLCNTCGYIHASCLDERNCRANIKELIKKGKYNSTRISVFSNTRYVSV